MAERKKISQLCIQGSEFDNGTIMTVYMNYTVAKGQGPGSLIHFSPSTLDPPKSNFVNKIVISFQKRNSGVLAGVEVKYREIPKENFCLILATTSLTDPNSFGSKNWGQFYLKIFGKGPTPIYQNVEQTLFLQTSVQICVPEEIKRVKIGSKSKEGKF